MGYTRAKELFQQAKHSTLADKSPTDATKHALGAIADGLLELTTWLSSEIDDINSAISRLPKK